VCGCWLPQAGKYNRLDLQQVMVQAIPWLDWQHHAKGADARALAEWLWWLAVQAQQQGVAGATVATDQPAGFAPRHVAPCPGYRPGYRPGYPYMY
jgi:hypothetical protein